MPRRTGVVSFREAIDRFPSQMLLARAIGKAPSSVRSWFHRDSIPPEWFERIGAAARAYEVPLTERHLRKLFHARLRGKLQQED